MDDFRTLADIAADIELSPPQVLAKGYRDYLRYRVTLKRPDGARVEQTRDIVQAGKVVALLPIDLARDELVLLRQFRLPAHLANGKGDLLEIVAGRVDAGETLADAARRECREEIGVTPGKLVEIATYLTTPGLTDEEVTIFVTPIDASSVREGAHVSPDGEQLHIFRAPVEAALQALAHGTMRGSPVIIALQWLALNRGRLGELLA
ncbi:MAG: NUDIX hydrolase [Pseudolabrys sp.]